MYSSPISEERQRHSEARLAEVANALAKSPKLACSVDLTVYVVGSYARLEASQYSDIDLFFLDTAGGREEDSPENEEVVQEVSGIIHDLGFPEGATQVPYRRALTLDGMTRNLGGSMDDYQNYFTSRMLLLLESRCLHGEAAYGKAISQTIQSYLRDFPGHQDNFRPVFLTNDIMRYWKTLCLNYEHKRYKHEGNRTKIIKHKVRNFKLKMSRMTTCFATLASFACHSPITEEILLQLVRCTPRERLDRIAAEFPQSDSVLSRLRVEYDWFLELTGLPTKQLEDRFADRDERRRLFERANSYGDTMFSLLQMVDPDCNLIRFLVI